MANKRKRFASGGESSTGDEGIDPISGLPTVTSMPEYSGSDRAIRSERPDERPDFSKVEESSIGNLIKKAIANAPPEAFNVRYSKDAGLGYKIPIGKNQSLTPSIGKGRVGITYTMEGLKKGGSVKSASSRADGCCKRGKTRGKMV